MTLADVEQRLRNSRAVLGIVSTMRALSAVQLRRGSEALMELRSFEAVLREALSRIDVPALESHDPERVMCIVIGSDQGMCGGLTRRIVDRALARREYLGGRAGAVIAVGFRTEDLLTRAGITPQKVLSAPTSVAGVERLVERVGRTIEGSVAAKEHDGVEVAYTQHLGMGSGSPAITRVFPIDRERLLARGTADTPNEGTPPRPPQHVQLLEPAHRVAHEVYDLWTITETYRAAVEALTSEHAARLRTTDASTHTIEGRIEELLVEQSHLRQAQITEELHEIIAGGDRSRR